MGTSPNFAVVGVLHKLVSVYFTTKVFKLEALVAEMTHTPEALHQDLHKLVDQTQLSSLYGLVLSKRVTRIRIRT
jgi:hypothetical protein